MKALVYGRRLLISGKKFLLVHWFLVFAIVAYSTLTAYYMGPSIAHCTDTVYGYGDNTAGPIWKFWLPGGQTPTGHSENYTNYPWGENLYSPVGDSSALQATALWTFSKVAGPVCGYNLMNIVGFTATALVMCGFVYWLFRRRWLAWLAGYVVSYTPYFQYKVGGHPSYGWAGLLILALWALLKLLRENKKRDAVFLGLSTGACFYWDPYFTLLVTVLLFPVALTWLVYNRYQILGKGKREQVIPTRQRFSNLLLAFIIIVALFMPLAFVRFFQSSQIGTYLTNTRSDVLFDAEHCSTLPQDYILPSDNNWFAGSVFHRLYILVSSLHHGCNPSEYTVGIAYVVSVTVGLTAIIFTWEKINKRRLFTKKETNGNDVRFLYVSLVIMVLTAAALAFPPTLSFFKFPSYYMLALNPGWRILDRLYLDINIGLTVLFVLGLIFFGRLPVFRRQSYRIGASVLIFIMLFVQYQPFRPFSGSVATFSYRKDVPGIFYWLHDQKDIKTIAGYPMDRVGESDNITRYVTYQKIDGKKLLNSTVPGSPQEALRFSIKDLTAPQTLPILRSLGIDALEIHYLTPEQIKAALPELTIANYFNGLTIFPEQVAIAKIPAGPKQDYALVLKAGFPLNGEIMKSAVDIQYEVQNNASIAAENIFGRDDAKKQVPVCFNIKTADPADQDVLNMKVAGKTVLGPLPINSEYQTVTFSAYEGQTINLANKTGHDMRLEQLGCNSKI